MATHEVNDMDTVKAKTTEFLTELMKQSNLHFTEFFDAVNEACLEVGGEFVQSVMINAGDD